MPSREDYVAYPNGQFSWTDISLADVAAGKQFYQELFGWTGEDQFDPDGNLIYVMFSSEGETVAGMGPLPPGMEGGGFPPMWQSYVSVDSVDDTVAAVLAAGGAVIMPAMDVMDSGRMAVLADSDGAMFSIWQAGTHAGATKFGAPGFMAWNELMTRDVDAAKAFYNTVFGWAYEDNEMPAGFVYSTISLGEHANGGMMPMGEEFPAEIPPHWMTYFMVEDTEAAAAKLKGLGGSVSVPPFDTPAGKIAIVGDPQGGTFSIIGPPPEA